MNRDPHLLTNAEILVVGEPNQQLDEVEAILDTQGCHVQRAVGQGAALVSALVDPPELILIAVRGGRLCALRPTP